MPALIGAPPNRQAATQPGWRRRLYCINDLDHVAILDRAMRFDNYRFSGSETPYFLGHLTASPRLAAHRYGSAIGIGGAPGGKAATITPCPFAEIL